MVPNSRSQEFGYNTVSSDTEFIFSGIFLYSLIQKAVILIDVSVTGSQKRSLLMDSVPPIIERQCHAGDVVLKAMKTHDEIEGVKAFSKNVSPSRRTNKFLGRPSRPPLLVIIY